MRNKKYACSILDYGQQITIKSFLGILIFLFSLYSAALNAQTTEPKIADFGREETKVRMQSPEVTTLIRDEEISFDTTFQIDVEQITKYYQSTRMILSIKNSSNLLVNHIWFQVRLLNKNGEFLYREQPVLFTEVKPNQSIRYELIFESIDPEQIGYVVFRPELIELESIEYPIKESFFKLKNSSLQQIQAVFNTRFR